MDFEEWDGEERLIYRGKEVIGISPTGFPYKGALSIFEEIKRKDDVLKSRGEKFQLDDFTVGDLLAESRGYELRAHHHLTHPQNTEKGISDLDKARAIMNFIFHNALSEEYEKRAKMHLDNLNFTLTIALSTYAIEQPNYAWARGIIRDKIKEIEKQKSEEVYPGANYDGAISFLEERLKHVGIREGHFGGAVSDIIPVTIPHDRSLVRLLQGAAREERYKEANELKKRIDSIEEGVEEALYPEIIALGRKFLLEHVSSDVKSEIKRGSVLVYDPKKLVWIYKTMFKRPGIKIYDKEAYPRALGVLHSDDIVFEFGRFFVDLRLD